MQEGLSKRGPPEGLVLNPCYRRRTRSGAFAKKGVNGLLPRRYGIVFICAYANRFNQLKIILNRVKYIILIPVL